MSARKNADVQVETHACEDMRRRDACVVLGNFVAESPARRDADGLRVARSAMHFVCLAVRDVVADAHGRFVGKGGCVCACGPAEVWWSAIQRLRSYTNRGQYICSGKVHAQHGQHSRVVPTRVFVHDLPRNCPNHTWTTYV